MTTILHLKLEVRFNPQSMASQRTDEHKLSIETDIAGFYALNIAYKGQCTRSGSPREFKRYDMIK